MLSFLLNGSSLFGEGNSSWYKQNCFVSRTISLVEDLIHSIVTFFFMLFIYLFFDSWLIDCLYSPSAAILLLLFVPNNSFGFSCSLHLHWVPHIELVLYVYLQLMEFLSSLFGWTFRFHLPIAYHGRASSIVISGTDIVRPRCAHHERNLVFSV